MWRFLAGVTSTLLLVAAGLFFWKGIAQSEDPISPPPVVQAPPSPLEPPPSAERSREEKRFDRYDKDRDQLITSDEYLAPRQKAFTKLDVNGDGRLSFEEWAVRTSDKFAKADADGSKALSRDEFLTTRVKRKPPPRCNCNSEEN
ncbi:MAG: histidine kinase [Sphingomonadaceae bacterium]